MAENESDLPNTNGARGTGVNLDPWDIAPRYLSHLGSISQMVAGCSRALMTDERAKQPGPTVVLSTSEFPVERLFNSPSVICHFYYALATYYPDKLAQHPRIEAADLVTLMPPPESALVIMITYFYRRTLKRLQGKDITAFSRQMQNFLDLAQLFGRSVPGIGVQTSLMVASGRFLGWGIFFARDEKLFKKYKVGIKLKKTPFDFKQEIEIWSTTHAHIACAMFQSFGFGVDAIEAYANGVLAPEPGKLGQQAMKFAIAQQWLDSLTSTGKAPPDPISLELSPMASGLAELQGMVASQREESEAAGGWLFSRRTDLTPEKTPALIFDYAKIEPSKHAVAGTEDVDNEET